ncbi:DUF3383 family protein [Metabacillus fastidiosus]|uniref:DUF3383 family protein n=1 Tax=Metabacillus fastidiosus TaxID=1458 RepID=UPI002E213CD5|nr:DUF3383 family protein [Metabacillus fastidiosus]
MALKDVSVIINVLHPAEVIGLGRPIIFTVGSKASYKEYRSLEALTADFNISTPTHKLAETIWAQKNKPKVIAVATYVDIMPTAGQSLAEVIEAYYEKLWHFALLADSTPAERLVLSNAVELHDFKFAVVQTKDKTELSAFKHNAHTIPYYHTNDGERLDGAVIGDAASLTVGSITWKFRHDLKAVTPIDITSDELEDIHELGANCYVEKAGVPQTSEGLVATGEYIDFYHGRDWIKVNGETELQALLVNNDKIPSNDNGISMIASTLTNVLTIGGKQGIIDINKENQYDFTVNTISWEETDPDDQAKRVYSGVTFSYRAQGAIHKINVTGEVMSNK